VEKAAMNSLSYNSSSLSYSSSLLSSSLVLSDGWNG